jgi:hypothetical protein
MTLRRSRSLFRPFQNRPPAQTAYPARSDPQIAGNFANGKRYRGARLARMRCRVRRCMFNRRAVSETLRLHIS